MLAIPPQRSLLFVAFINPARRRGYLHAAGLPDPDLIIRTNGEIHLSGLLLWQSPHSDFYFSDVYWPAFRKIDFLRAVRCCAKNAAA